LSPPENLVGGKMITLRAIAVGLGLCAFFMVHFFEKYLTYAGKMKAWGIVIGLTELDPVFQTAGAQMFFFTSYAFLCLAAGMVFASFYPKLESIAKEKVERMLLILHRLSKVPLKKKTYDDI
jgi:hypothetical protein